MLRPLLAMAFFSVLLIVNSSVPVNPTKTSRSPRKKKQKSDKEEQKKEPKRPSLSLKATPVTGCPCVISATADFKGGDHDFQDYCCCCINSRNWGDGNGLGSLERCGTL